MQRANKNGTKKANWSLMKSRENLKMPQGKWKWEYNFPKYTGCGKSSSREVHSHIGLPQA